MTYFPYNAQVAGALVEELAHHAGGSIDKLKLVKLMYLVDRTALIEEGYPVIGGKYCSMPYGPVISEFLDDLNNGKWEEDGIRVRGNAVCVTSRKLEDYLSDWIRELAGRVYEQYRTLDGVQLMKLLHKECREWKDPDGSSVPISLSDIPGCSAKEAEAFAAELNAMSK